MLSETQRKAFNARSKAKAALARKVKDTTYGLPIDQLTFAESQLVRLYPNVFENDNGYIKLKKTGRRNPKPHPTELSISDREKIIKGLRADIQRAKEIEIYRGRGMAPVIRDINKRIKKQLDEIAKQSGKIKNHTATAQGFRNFQKERVNEHVEMFQGKNDGKQTRLLKSDLAPKEDMPLLGKLVLMRTKRDGKNFDVHFDGNATLAMDGRKNLWTAGSDSIITDFKKPHKDAGLHYIGKLYQVDYVTAKQHIENGETVRFYHKLGEVTGDCPRLYIDHDGFPIIIGGGYDVWDVGIVN